MRKVVIVGRPNVGKSTLFNKWVGDRKAIFSPDKGVTRDRIESLVEILGKKAILVDTGGIVESEGSIESQIREQVNYAINEADLILFFVDALEGLHPLDKTIADWLRRTEKNVILVVNKCDNETIKMSAQEFYTLGFGHVFFISSAHKIGLGDLLEEISKYVDEELVQIDLEAMPKIAFIGKPNVGKSSLINKILGSNRVIVSDIPGTTRDAVDIVAEIGGEKYVFIDTAGLRRKSRVSTKLEAYSITRTVESIERADVVVLLVDSTQGITEQDKKIAGVVVKRKKPIIIALNKIDIFEGSVKELLENVKSEFYFIPEGAPIIPISAVTGKNIGRLLSEIRGVYTISGTRRKTSEVNKAIEAIVAKYHPYVKSGKPIKVYYGTQVGVRPPSFVVFANFPEEVSSDYKRYFEKNIAKELGFEKVPIEVVWRKRE
jgi:GTP-binding protein